MPLYHCTLGPWSGAVEAPRLADAAHAAGLLCRQERGVLWDGFVLGQFQLSASPAGREPYPLLSCARWRRLFLAYGVRCEWPFPERQALPRAAQTAKAAPSGSEASGRGTGAARGL